MKVTLAGQVFNSRKSAEDFVRENLKNFDPDSPLWPELLSRHPDKESKIGPGIRAFFTAPNLSNPSAISLNIIRIDGSIIDISWLKCVSQKQDMPEQSLKVAMRLAIKDQIQSFKIDRFIHHKNGWHCEECNCFLSRLTGCHADHHFPQFNVIANLFLEEFKDHPKEFDDCRFSHSAKFRKEDVLFETAWAEFHRSRAMLRILCKKCNLSRART